MKNRIFGYSAVALMAVLLILTIIENRQDDKKFSKLETTLSDLRTSDSIKGDSIKLLTSALQSQLESHCDTMTVEQRLKLLEFQKYEVRMWNEKEKAEMNAYTQKEKANMSAYKQKERESLKSYLVFEDARHRSLKELSEKHPKEFIQYVIAEFWKDNSYGENSYKRWEEFEKIEKIPGVKDHVTLEKQAYSIYESANKKYEAEYSETTKKNEQSYEAQKKALEHKYDILIAQKKLSLGL
jgi:hypothetical protein